MKVQSGNENEKVISVAAAIESDMSSWIGWSALHIDATVLAESSYAESVESAKSIVMSYLGDVKGSAYFCPGQNVYIVCKNASTAVLRQTAAQLCEMAFGNIVREDQCHLYDLGRHGHDFATRVYQDIGDACAVHAEMRDMPAWMQADDMELRGHRKKVLLVEDDPVVRWMVRQALKSECEFLSADTAGKAFATYTECRPDIVLLDIGLPDDSGNEVLSWIMRNDPAACVIMMSGKDDVDSISGCMEKGARGFIAKPFVKNILLDYVRKYG